MIIILGIIVVLVIYFVSVYNSFVIIKTRIAEALSGIDVQLKRRADLIPNLVETVKGYAKHEQAIFENVTKARSALMGAGTLKEKGDANTELSGALKSLFAVAEAYPDLKANANFQELQRQLEDTEDKVSYSRQFYNSNVLDYNARLQTFPSNMIASMFNFKPAEFFQATDEERKNVKVSFN